MHRPSAGSARLSHPAALCLVALTGGGLVALTGCVDKDRRMGEYESMQYRKQLIKKHHFELSPRQQRDLWHHPGRTQNQIDHTLADYRRSFREQQARDAADALESRHRADSQLDDLRRVSDTSSDVEGSGGAGSGVDAPAEGAEGSDGAGDS